MNKQRIVGVGWGATRQVLKFDAVEWEWGMTVSDKKVASRAQRLILSY